MNNIDKIEELYETVKNDPSNFQAVRELSVALLDSGYNEEALKQLVYLVGIFPEDDRLYFNIGITFEKLKMFQKAEYSYRKAISISEKTDYYYNLGYLLLNQNKNLREAYECFKKVLEKEPEDANTYFCLGMLYLKKKIYERSIKCFKKAYKLNSYDILSLFYMGNTYHQMGDKENARAIYNEVLKISPEYSWAYFNLAQIDWNAGNIDSAIINLNKVLEINDKDIDAIKLLCQIYIKIKDVDKAQDLLQKSLEQNPYNGDLMYFMAQTFNNDKEKQKQYLNKALENYKTLTISSKQIKTELKKLKEC